MRGCHQSNSTRNLNKVNLFWESLIIKSFQSHNGNILLKTEASIDGSITKHCRAELFNPFYWIFNLLSGVHWIVHDITTLLASGVFLLSVMTILGSPPSATEQRYMCRKDLPWTGFFWVTPVTFHLRSTLSLRDLCTYFVTPFCNLNNLLDIRILPKVHSGEYQFSVNFNLQEIFNKKYL